MTSLTARPELLPCYCPIEPAIHPEVDRIERQALAWVDTVLAPDNDADRARVRGTNSAEFFSRFAPYGLAENVQLAAQWVYWGFAFDDARCDAGALSEEPAEFAALAGAIQRVLETPGVPPPAADRFAAPMHDIADGFRSRATPVQVRRFIEAHRHWLFCVDWQVGNRARRHMPDLNEYAAMRLGSCGGPPTFAMLEIANGAEVPAAEMHAPAVQALTEMACLVAGWDNDIHSYRKEEVYGYAEQNVINVLAREGHSTEQAIVQATGIRDRVMRRFLRLREQVSHRGSLELRTYLDCLGRGIRGNIDWAARTPRYRNVYEDASHAGAPGAGAGLVWTEAPSDLSPAPVPLPSISWWWDEFLP